MLKGEYVGLRAIDRTDLKILLDWRNQPSFRRFFREYRELNMDMQNAWYEKVVLANSGTRMFAIVQLSNKQLIGACGLCSIDWINRNADFSIYIGDHEIYIDNVFAPDAVRILIQYAFDELGLHRLWAEIYEFDHAKKELFEAFGFFLEGRHRETHWCDGRWWDSLFYGLLASD